MGADTTATTGSARAINCTPRTWTMEGRLSAINCTPEGRWRVAPIVLEGCSRALTGPPANVQQFLSNSTSTSTRRAYRADLRHFEAWGGALPSSPNKVAEYLAALATTHTASTITRRLAGLAKAHRAMGADDPTKAEIVRATMRGIRRTIGTAQRVAKPILREDLFAILDRMGNKSKDIRDKALLLIGFAGAFRRSELVALDVADIEHVRQGMIITLRRSKTDQAGAGRKIGIPLGRTRWCPVAHLTNWLDHAGLGEGPIFQPINRNKRVSNQRLSGEAVSIIVKKRVEAAGFNAGEYSGHSLRAGLATSAVLAGVSTHCIRRTTGHASDAMLARYVRISELFTENAASAVL